MLTPKQKRRLNNKVNLLDIKGISPKTLPAIKKAGINTPADILELPVDEMGKRLKRAGVRYLKHLGPASWKEQVTKMLA